MSLFSSVWRDLESGYRMGNMVRKLLLINIIVFVSVKLLLLICNISAGFSGDGVLYMWNILNYFCMPADWKELLWHIWSPITSIFLHEGFFHLVGNMIWLSLFGTIVGDLIGDRRVLPIYLLGGLAGGLMYFISANLAPNIIGAHALGASAAVMALAGTALILNPDYRVALLFLGEIKIKYVVLFMVLLDLVGVSGMPNAGGHAAHLGGFVMGVMFVYALRNRKDWSEPINVILERIQAFFSNIINTITGRNRSKLRVVHTRKPASKYTESRKGNASTDLSHQEKLDQILDKIKQKGFDQISQEEKDFLYDASKK